MEESIHLMGYLSR